MRVNSRTNTRMRLIDHILLLSDAYCQAVGLSRARVSTLVFRRGGKIDAIAGGADVTTASYEHALAWFAQRWPQGAAWPDGVPRVHRAVQHEVAS